jgi:hypothetical protein
MTVKFFFNGVKVDGVLYRGLYSMGPYNECSKLPEGTITMYARDYATEFPKIEGVTVENNSDTMTDYFEKDTMRIQPDSPYYADAKAAFEKEQVRFEERRRRKCGKKQLAKAL